MQLELLPEASPTELRQYCLGQILTVPLGLMTTFIGQQLAGQ